MGGEVVLWDARGLLGLPFTPFINFSCSDIVIWVCRGIVLMCFGRYCMLLSTKVNTVSVDRIPGLVGISITTEEGFRSSQVDAAR